MSSKQIREYDTNPFQCNMRPAGALGSTWSCKDGSDGHTFPTGMMCSFLADGELKCNKDAKRSTHSKPSPMPEWCASEGACRGWTQR